MLRTYAAGVTAPARTYGEAVGFDPQRKHRRSNFDYWYVGGALLLCLALVVWAFFG
jgi:hypothetical protein